MSGADVLTAAFGDEVVILNLRDGVYYGLDAVGARIWQLVSEATTLTAIRDALLDEYDVERGRCDSDLRALVAELAARGLLEVRADG